MFNEFVITSETTLTLYSSSKISIEQQKICWAFERLAKSLDNVLNVVVGMNTICVYTNDINYKELCKLKLHLDSLYKETKPIELDGKLVEIPVDYGGELGFDLLNLAKLKKLSIKEVVDMHTNPIYTVYFIGFLPGFAYLGGLDNILNTPRLSIPRTKIPAGSVGIGGAQTGIYPLEAPGGWNIIGNTIVKLFDINKEQPSLLKAGDRLKFVVNSIKESL